MKPINAATTPPQMEVFLKLLAPEISKGTQFGTRPPHTPATAR